MKVSIITINYNNAAGLERTIESIIPKKIEAMEYIVIDGGSTDTSHDVILHHKEKIDYWVSESDKGIYNAMNKGIAQATGEYVIFINSGDALEDDASLSILISQLSSGEDLIYHNLRIVADNGFIKEYPKQLDFLYFIHDTLPHTGTFIKKELFTKYGNYREDLNIVSDWAFFIDAVILHECSYKHIDGHFSKFYFDGISSAPENRDRILEEKRNHIEKKFPHYYSFYTDWLYQRSVIYRLSTSRSIKLLKKFKFLKWLSL